ncbi:MAG TPA: Nif3-like dinuclear metal center hexameric protein [Spirochaetota bacterium]
MKRNDLVDYLDTYLRVKEIKDEALNGLQVEGSDEVSTIAVAVDASLATFEAAAERGAQFLIVHHGLFFGDIKPITGTHCRRIKTLLDHGISLYASHLPLDLHPEVGNNVEIARVISLYEQHPFGEYHGVSLGCGGMLEQKTDPHSIAKLLSAATGNACSVYANGDVTSKIAIVSGGGAYALDEAARSGYDTLITGETKHSSYHPAKEYGISVIFGGHYGTETFGVKALAKRLADEFALPHHFIDIPTGM